MAIRDLAEYCLPYCPVRSIERADHPELRLPVPVGFAHIPSAGSGGTDGRVIRPRALGAGPAVARCPLGAPSRSPRSHTAGDMGHPVHRIPRTTLRADTADARLMAGPQETTPAQKGPDAASTALTTSRCALANRDSPWREAASPWSRTPGIHRQGSHATGTALVPSVQSAPRREGNDDAHDDRVVDCCGAYRYRARASVLSGCGRPGLAGSRRTVEHSTVEGTPMSPRAAGWTLITIAIAAIVIVLLLVYNLPIVSTVTFDHGPPLTAPATTGLSSAVLALQRRSARVRF